ncbi:RCC1 domain-containing protein 1 [Lutzomyia longipalpis]|uniref:RCC1 domain-containing protein 1 n=1 Tax=Lutzomyia longipalpis TaxID=7200 RepID=UPI002483B513|nr:RCC1 domain-containing protein 1 [Lutzomyia longipalpis]
MGRLSNVLYVGQNGFKQFRDDTRLPSFDFAEINIEPQCENFEGKSIKVDATLAYSVVAVGCRVIFKGFLEGKEMTKSHKFLHDIRDISCNSKHCLILLANGELFRYSVERNHMLLLNFIATEGDLKTGEHLITHIACGETKNIAVTNQNVIYDIPSKIYKFDKHIKVQKISCGHEHAVLLTKNGDVFSWGNGLRGQLGHGDLENRTEPELIEALAGIKIIDISAGGWHNAAVSAFGDLYTWGWNVNGQLGIAVSNPSLPSAEFTPVVFSLPEIIELPCNNEELDLDSQFKIISVACGNQHTFIKTECGKILSSGLNAFGQLSVPKNNKRKFQDKFLIVKEDASKWSIICGTYCTILLSP